MNKAIASTALAALVVVSLSGCTFGLLKPNSTPAPPAPQAETSEQSDTQATDDTQLSDDTQPDAATSSGFGDVQSYFCEDGESLEVTNSDYAEGILYVTGECNVVTISADNVTVFIDSAVSLNVPGYYSNVDLASSVSDVTVMGDLATITGASAASLYVDGYANTLTFDSADSVSVGGTDNVVSWFGGTSSGSDTGTGNILLAP